MRFPFELYIDFANNIFKSVRFRVLSMIFHVLIHIIPCNNQRCEVKIFTLFYFPALAIAAWETMQERGTVSLNLTENHKAVQNITSGNKISDKLGKAGLTASRAEKVDAPVINEYS